MVFVVLCFADLASCVDLLFWCDCFGGLLVLRFVGGWFLWDSIISDAVLVCAVCVWFGIALLRVYWCSVVCRFWRILVVLRFLYFGGLMLFRILGVFCLILVVLFLFALSAVLFRFADRYLFVV